jgi:hypothetical protein
VAVRDATSSGWAVELCLGNRVVARTKIWAAGVQPLRRLLADRAG